MPLSSLLNPCLPFFTTSFLQFSYEASEVQLTFLRLLSTRAHQNVTYHCKNSVAVNERETGSTEQALRLMTTSDVELSLDAPSLEQYEVIEDGCQVSY